MHAREPDDVYRAKPDAGITGYHPRTRSDAFGKASVNAFSSMPFLFGYGAIFQMKKQDDTLWLAAPVSAVPSFAPV